MFLYEILWNTDHLKLYTINTPHSHTKKAPPLTMEAAVLVYYASTLPATITHLLLLLDGCSFFSLFTESRIHWCCSSSLRLGLIRIRWSGA